MFKNLFSKMCQLKNNIFKNKPINSRRGIKLNLEQLESRLVPSNQQVYTWTNASGDSEYNNPANWNINNGGLPPNQVAPTENDTVEFTSGSGICDIDQSGSEAGNLVVNSGFQGDINITNSLYVGTLTCTGTGFAITQGKQGTITIDKTIDSNGAGTSIINMEGRFNPTNNLSLIRIINGSFLVIGGKTTGIGDQISVGSSTNSPNISKLFLGSPNVDPLTNFTLYNGACLNVFDDGEMDFSNQDNTSTTITQDSVTSQTSMINDLGKIVDKQNGQVTTSLPLYIGMDYMATSPGVLTVTNNNTIVFDNPYASPQNMINSGYGIFNSGGIVNLGTNCIIQSNTTVYDAYGIWNIYSNSSTDGLYATLDTKSGGTDFEGTEINYIDASWIGNITQVPAVFQVTNNLSWDYGLCNINLYSNSNTADLVSCTGNLTMGDVTLDIYDPAGVNIGSNVLVVNDTGTLTGTFYDVIDIQDSNNAETITDDHNIYLMAE